MIVVAIIPARLNSTRFPGKPLALLRGKPMIQHVHERTCEVSGLSRVIVATPDVSIAEVVRSFGGTVVMTSAHNATGTDAIAEVARGHAVDMIVNVQGDLPFFHPSMVNEAISALRQGTTASMSTVKRALPDPDTWATPHIVKVATDRDGYALYFSRSVIPHPRMAGARPITPCYQHIGVYVYWRAFLLQFAKLARTPLEQIESLEQLRALEHGYRIVVSETEHPTLEVDTPEDLQRAEETLLAWGM